VKTVLFVCVHNAGRSQIAEALFNQLAGQRGIPARAESAGTEPAGQVHPEVVEVMRERGIDLSRRRPHRLAEAHVRRAWRVITMGCAPDAGSCPALFLREVQDWALPDPRGRPLEEVRALRDEIERRVSALLDEIAAATPLAEGSARPA